MKDIQHNIFALQTEQEFVNLAIISLIIIGYVAYNFIKNYE